MHASNTVFFVTFCQSKVGKNAITQNCLAMLADANKTLEQTDGQFE
jgi:hypothetical protein